MADFSRKTLVVLGIASGFVLLWLMVMQGIPILLIGFAGILLALLLRGISNFVAGKTGLSEGLALLLVIIALFAIFALTLWLRANELSNQIQMLSSQLPTAFASLKSQFAHNAIIQDMVSRLPDLSSSSLGNPGKILSKITGVFSGTLTVISGVLLIFVLAIFLAADPELYIGGTLRLVPPQRRPRAREILLHTGATLRQWLFAKLLLMIFVGVATYIGLLVLDVPLTLTLAILAGLLDFVPNFGPFIAALPAALIALMQSPRTALWVLALYFVVQILENYVLTPIIQKKVVKLAPALTIAVQILLGALLGFLGMVFAIPLTAAAIVLIQELYIKDTLSDPDGSS